MDKLFDELAKSLNVSTDLGTTICGELSTITLTVASL